MWLNSGRFDRKTSATSTTSLQIRGMGRSVREVSKQLGVTDKTYYRWRKEYGGLGTDQA